MKKLLALLLLLGSTFAVAQTPLLGNPIDRGPTLPASCYIGQGLYFKTSAADGNGAVGIYWCVNPAAGYPANWQGPLGPTGTGSFSAGGDLSGTSSSQEVIGILSHTLPALTTGYLNWTGTAWALSAVSGSGTVNAGTATHLGYYATSTTAISDAGADLVFNGTHTYSAASTLVFNLSGATGTAALRVPSNSTNTASAAGAIDFDTTGLNYHVFANGADAIVGVFASAPTNGHCVDVTVSAGNVLLADAGSACGSGGGISFPQTVSGTTNSGGIPYFSNVTTLTSSATLTQYGSMYGGGTGAAPTVVTPPSTNGLYLLGYNVTGSAALAPTATVSTGLPAGTAIGSVDTGTPKLTFGTNSITANQPLTVSGSVGLVIATEGACSGAVSGSDVLCADATLHAFKSSLNNGSFVAIPQLAGDFAGTAASPTVKGISGAVAGSVFDMHAATGTAALKVPTNTSNTASAAGVIDFDSTANNYHVFANGADAIVAAMASTPTNLHCAQFSVSGGNVLLSDAGGACTTGGSGDTITSPNSTLTVGGTTSNTTLDVTGAAGKILAGSTPALTFTPALGVDNTNAGTLQLSNGSANAHTILGSAATTTNTVNFFAAVPTTGHLVDCAVASTTCTLHDSGVVTANVVNASSPGAGVAHFAGSTQTVTSSAVVGSDMTNNTVTATQLAAQYSKGSCTEAWAGSGTAFALTAGDDAASNNTCYNDSGVTRTITAVKCRNDNASNTTTVNPTFGSAGTGTTICSGALTCGNSYAYSSTCTVSNASWTTGTGIDPAMSGTLTGTSIAVIVEYTY